jgi:3-hydroxyacyl-[acyl-carrier-protein] dehydratase
MRLGRGLAYNNKFAGYKAAPQGECVRCDGERTMLFDVNDIQKLLPHRYPFLMIDGILEMERLKTIVGIKNVTINEHFFQGHFPGKPIMPGVLIIEAMAQTGGLLLLTEIPDRDSKLLYFVAVDKARFRRPVVPGDQLRLEIKVLHWRGGDFAKLEGKATVDGQVAAEATLMCKMVDREPKPAAAKAKAGSDEQKAEQPKA